MKLTNILTSVFLTLILGGCSNKSPQFVEILWSPDFEHGRTEWRAEIEPLYPSAVVVHAHGEYFGERWVLIDDRYRAWYAESVVAEMNDRYPNQTVILISCNSRGYVIQTPNTVYATEDVWIVPDASVPEDIQEARDNMHGQEVIGAISEFVVND